MSDNESFRDSISTISEEGKRSWVYPKKPKGRFYDYRKYVSYVLLIFLLASPFIKVNGKQCLLFNFIERKFNVFGFPFWPQDFYLLVISMLIGIVSITLFTVAFGRVFCGWICPQTIFMEMVFRRIEYWIEGDRGKQMRLDRQKWDAEKIRKKGLKWFIFALISFVIANVFLAYLIGSDSLFLYIQHGPLEHVKTFLILLAFTGVFYFIFTWFREQVCVIACPYGRLQSVLLDEQSIVVAYDYKRGERELGRSKFRRGENREELGKGDCIDCDQCVQVCPTGIDIRNGTQLECINCTACIDACDSMMEAVDLPKGLIRFASEENISKGRKFKFTRRMKAYTAVLTILVGVLISLLFVRSDLDATILRLPGQLFERKGEHMVSNVYTYKLINKTNKDIDSVSFKLLNYKGEVKLVKHNFFEVEGQEYAEGTMFIEIDERALKSDKSKLEIGIFSGDKKLSTTKAVFSGPRSF